MENIKNSLKDFYNNNSNLFREYFRNVNQYLKDLYHYKKINLKTNPKNLKTQEIDELINEIYKITEVGLNATGIPKERLTPLKNTLFSEKYDSFEYQNFEEFKIIFMNPTIRQLLFLSLIESIQNQNNEFLKKITQFDLIPQELYNNIKYFCRNWGIKEKEYQKFLKNFELEEISDDFRNIFSFNHGIIVSNNRDILKSGEFSELEFIDELENAIRVNLETLNNDVKKSKSNHEIQGGQTVLKSIDSYIRYDNLRNFPYYIDNLPIFDQVELKNFNLGISFENLIDKFPHLFTLESLYYYFCICHILQLRKKININKISKLLHNQFKNGIFISSDIGYSVLEANFYGIILSYYLNESNILTNLHIEKIEKLLIDYLANISYGNVKELYLSLIIANFINLKVHLNEDQKYISELQDYNIKSIDPKNLINDLFYYVFSYALLGNPIGLTNKLVSKVDNIISKKIITNVNPNYLLNCSITELSRLLLILQELDLLDKYTEFKTKLLDYLLNFSTFFEDYPNYFSHSWRNNKLLLIVELKLLFCNLVIRKYRL